MTSMLVDAGSRFSTCPICFRSDRISRNIYHSCRNVRGGLASNVTLWRKQHRGTHGLWEKSSKHSQTGEDLCNSCWSRPRLVLERPIPKVCLLQKAEVWPLSSERTVFLDSLIDFTIWQWDMVKIILEGVCLNFLTRLDLHSREKNILMNYTDGL